MTSESDEKRGAPAFDFARLADISGGDPRLARQLLSEFLLSAPTVLDRMRAAVERRDTGDLESSARTLAGGCAMLGAQRLATACRKLEHLAERNVRDPVVADLERAEQEFASLRSVLTEQLAERAA